MKLLSRVGIFLLIIGFVSTYFFFDFLLELWWFNSLDLGSYFLLRESYSFLVILCSSVFFIVLAQLNLVIIPRRLDGQSNFFLLKNRYFSWLVCLLISIPLLIPIYTNWETFLLFYFSASSELTDPVYSKNLSFYFFSYPVYQLIQSQLLWFFSLIFIVISSEYYFSNKNNKEHAGISDKAKIHIGSLAFILVILQAWSIALERIDMLYEDRHLPVFFGPGFVEMSYQLTLIWFSFLLFLLLIGSAVYNLYSGKKIKLTVGLVLLYFSITAIKHIDFIPNIIDQYYVSPNPVTAESKYIKNHIKATSDAFNFSDITEINYPITQSVNAQLSTEIQRELSNIPLWDNELLLPVYKQLQSIRSYFSFNTVTVDRYLLNGSNTQVNVAARELDYKSLPKNAQNWRNQHLVYTHGYGLVMSPSEQQGNKPVQWIIQDFGQSVQTNKLKAEYPEIYYGLADYPYAIVPNTESLPNNNKSVGDLSTDYKGSGGVALSTIFQKIIVSSFLKDSKIFFSSGINSNSRILVRRNIYKRIKAIAPFLHLDKDAYPVLANNKVYWIIDAYTYSNKYPLVKPITLNKEDSADQAFNYARNSVKVVIDAYNGSINFYVTDKQDPIIKTYQRLYPSLFKNITDAPRALIKHFSYPKDWFSLQMKLYSKYHQKDPSVFYQQSDALEFAKMDDKTVMPYYLTMDIEELAKTQFEERQKFVLVSPLSPIGRDNLNTIALAGCLKTSHCDEHYQDDIFIYKLPDIFQVEGPAQISALMHQNPDISSQLSLWDQHGSKVLYGRIIIIPIDHSIIYIQPLYLESTSDQGFPSLAKVIVSMNRQTHMADSLTEAFKGLQYKMLLN